MNNFTENSIEPGRTPLRRGRRKHERMRLVYRLVHVEHKGDQGLARCRNISDGGMRLDLSMPMTVGSRIKVSFSGVHSYAGTVIWTKKGQCGVSLDRCIDANEVLRESAAETRAQGSPGLQLSWDLVATLRCDGWSRKIRVQELTQHSMLLVNAGDVYPGARLSVTLGADKERHGVVRRCDDGVAEIALLEPFSVAELGSLKALAPRSAEPRRAWGATTPESGRASVAADVMASCA